jgi:hypothetical protein
MRKSIFLIALIALLAVGSVMALTDYRTTSYQENKYAGARSLQEYDEGCPKIMVHEGYYVQQIYVRTARGFECQYPSKNKAAPIVTPTPLPIVENEAPECKEKKVCELVCDRYIWFWGHRICVDWDKECKTVNVCEE